MRYGEAYVDAEEQKDRQMHITIQGAGRGIGLALAHHTLTAGATHLYLTARNPEQSAGYAQLPPSPNIHWFAMDFLDPNSIANTCDYILAAAPSLTGYQHCWVLHDGDCTRKRLGALRLMRC